MAATRDPGWNRDDIDFDGSGRLVIKNAALAEKINEVLSCEGEVTVFTPPPPKGPGPTNMCGCNYKVPGPSVSQIPPEIGTQPPKKDA